MVEIKYYVPNLSSLDQHSPFFMFNRYFRGAGPKNYEAYALVMNFIRLVDLAICEYENGRNVLEEFLASKNNSIVSHLPIFASNHFEVCISTLKRIINYLKKLRGHPNVPRSLKNLLPKNSKVLSSQVENLITNMRHAIEHLENKIQYGEITFGQALCIMPVEDGIELGKYKILFRDLAEWLREVHKYSNELVQYREPNNKIQRMRSTPR